MVNIDQTGLELGAIIEELTRKFGCVLFNIIQRRSFWYLFVACNGSVLETLTDVGHEYFQDFCGRLRNAADNKLLHGYSGFPVGRLH